MFRLSVSSHHFTFFGMTFRTAAVVSPVVSGASGILVNVKLRNETRHLKCKALSSMRSAMTAFNSLDEDGRPSRVLIHLQHAFEMLLKAALVQDKVPVFDKETGRSIGFLKCVNRGGPRPLGLSDEEAGTLRTINAMRDQEQHWYTIVEEGLLYLYTRAGVTLFDDLLHRVFGERLADHLPLRVLPIGTEPPQDFQTLVDREYANIAGLLKPGRRARAEADARSVHCWRWRRKSTRRPRSVTPMSAA